MFSSGESNVEVYNQIIDLQKKLKQSEAERIRLEEMFDFLMKTLKEEKEMQLKSVENRYHAFLEDCARRNSRNENILRSVERIENAANILHAKSERLKLLRNYYEGYLERIIPFWKQSSLFYGPNQFSYNELDWIRRRQLISEEIPDNTSSLFHSTNFEGSKGLRLNESNNHRLIPDSEKTQFSGSLTSNWNNLNKSLWTQANKENEWGNKLGANHTVQKDNVHLSLSSSLSTNKVLDRTNRFRCDYFEQEIEQKNESLTNSIEPLSPQNILENDWELVQGNSRQQKFSNLEKNNCSENSYHILCQDDMLNKSKRLVTPSGEQKFEIKETSVKRKDEIIPEENMRLEKQLIVREPVEIKKPEFMVGKLHSDITKTFEGLENNAKHENLEKEDLNKKIKNMMEPESVFITRHHEESSLFELPHSEDVEIEAENKWSVLKQHDQHDNLKKILTENKSDLDENAMKLMKSIHRLSFAESQSSSKPKATKATPENNSGPQDNEKFLEFSRDKEEKPAVYEGQKIILTEEACELKDDEKNESGLNANVNEQAKGQFNNNFQKEGVCDLGEEVYEDNEESYPESYFEQPPKSPFAINLVSNVILEEDESEVNSNDACAEIECDNHTLQKNVEDEKCENASENVNDVDGQNVFNERNHVDVREICENPNLYENIISDEQSILNNHTNFYADETNYPNSFQEEVIYENRERSDDTYLSKEQCNNITEEHHGGDSFSEHCFENGHLQEIIEDGQIYQNQLNEQNQEITPTLEHYVNDDVPYQMQYCEQSSNNGRGVYYEQEGMNEEYFQNNLEQNSSLKGNQESAENFHQAHVGRDLPYSENGCPRQSVNNLAHLLESDSESFQIEHGSGIGNEDSDFDFSTGHQ